MSRTDTAVYFFTPIIKNHLRIFKNWIVMSELSAVIIICSAISLFLLYIAFYNLNSTPLHLAAGLMLIVSLPSYLTRLYTELLKKEVKILEVYVPDNTLIKVHHFLSLLFAAVCLFIILMLGGYKVLLNFPLYIWLPVITLFAVYNYIRPALNLNASNKRIDSKSSEMWGINLSAGLSPVKVIILREYSFLIRNNKTAIIKYITLFFLINTLVFLFYINNNITISSLVFLAVQFFIVVSPVLKFSTENDVTLLNESGYYLFDIFKAEFILSLSLFFLQMLVLIPFLILADAHFYLSLIPFTCIFIIYLAYAVIIRLKHIENDFLRNVAFVAGLFPLVTPFIFIGFYREIND